MRQFYLWLSNLKHGISKMLGKGRMLEECKKEASEVIASLNASDMGTAKKLVEISRTQIMMGMGGKYKLYVRPQHEIFSIMNRFVSYNWCHVWEDCNIQVNKRTRIVFVNPIFYAMLENLYDRKEDFLPELDQKEFKQKECKDLFKMSRK